MAEEQLSPESVSFQPRRQSLAVAYLLWLIDQKTHAAPSGCWEWQGAKNAAGYGFIDLKHYPGVAGSHASLHRVVYMACVGPLVEGMSVCHRCDNPGCLRPDHLFLGTNQDNIADKVAKGRHRSPRGEEHGVARLNAEQVLTIRQRVRSGESAASVSRDYGVSDTCVRDIVVGRTWKHLPDSPSMN